MKKSKDRYIDNLIVLIIVFILFGLLVIGRNVWEFKKTNIEVNNGSEDYAYNVSGSGEVVDNKEVEVLEDSGVTYSIRSFDATYYPYYQLLNIREKDLYNQIYANVINYKNIFIPKAKVNVKETGNALEALYYDHPEFFWLDSKYTFKYKNDNSVVQVKLTFNNTINNIKEAERLVDRQVNNILNVALRMDNNYDKEKYVHDVLINNIEYDLNGANNQSAYSALVSGKTVCAGYARAFQLIMIKLGIPTYFVTGTSKNEEHAWNMVRLDDGYYNVDLTWDDTMKSYYFFNNTDDYFNVTHKRSSLSSKLPRCNKSEYTLYNMNRKNVIKDIDDNNDINENNTGSNGNTLNNNVNNGNNNNGNNEDRSSNNIIGDVYQEGYIEDNDV